MGEIFQTGFRISHAVYFVGYTIYRNKCNGFNHLCDRIKL